MYNNETIYNNLMTILRKEKEGKTITENQFNELLLQCSWEVANDEYEKYESTQRETDAIKALKYSETILIDVFGEYDLSELTYTYWHPSFLNYVYNSNNVKMDVVTDGDWNERLTSDLMYPTSDFPIAKVMDDKLKFFPLAQTYSDTNLVTNSGYGSGTDWVDTNTDGVADDWFVFTNTADIITDQFGFDGRAQGAEFDSLDYISIYRTDFTQERNVPYYCEFEYYIQTGAGEVTLEIQLEFNVSVLTFTPTIGKKTKISFTFNSLEEVPVTNLFTIRFQNDQTEADRHCYVDKVFLSKVDEDLEATLGYLQEPNVPYFDYYYDANDEIIYLTPDTSYTLQTDETYIDKDDGTERTSPYEITASVNKSTELFLPSGERYKVLYCILQKMGISLNEQDAVQYGIVKEQKEKA